MKKGLVLGLMFLLALSLVLTGCGGTSAAPSSKGSGDGLPIYKLRLSSEYPVDNHQTIALHDAAKIIEEKTDGHVRITVYPSCQLGDYTVVYGQVMTGDIDIAALPIASSYDRRAEIMGMPYLAADFNDFKRVFFPGSFIWDVVSGITNNHGCTLLGIFNAGFMGIGAAKLPSEDFRVLTDGTIPKDTLIRIPPQNMYKYLISAMGYRTTTIPYADLYPALQSGIADGWIGGSALVNWEGFRDVINYFIDCRAVNECIPIVMNTKLLESMPEEWQQLIKDTLLEMSRRVADEREIQEKKALENLEKYGVRVIKPTAEELETLSDNIRAKVWVKMKDSLGEDIVKSLCEAYDVKI